MAAVYHSPELKQLHTLDCVCIEGCRPLVAKALSELASLRLAGFDTCPACFPPPTRATRDDSAVGDKLEPEIDNTSALLKALESSSGEGLVFEPIELAPPFTPQLWLARCIERNSIAGRPFPANWGGQSFGWPKLYEAYLDECETIQLRKPSAGEFDLAKFAQSIAENLGHASQPNRGSFVVVPPRLDVVRAMRKKQTIGPKFMSGNPFYDWIPLSASPVATYWSEQLLSRVHDGRFATRCKSYHDRDSSIPPQLRAVFDTSQQDYILFPDEMEAFEVLTKRRAHTVDFCHELEALTGGQPLGPHYLALPPVQELVRTFRLVAGAPLFMKAWGDY